ncbi:putative DNA helicase [Acinetobacter phage BS46]|nr:putative DNA helicase [Acinetobacter phage BS46]
MAARNFDKVFDAKVIKAKMNSDVELAIQILRDGLVSKEISAKDKIKLANDYLGLFLKLDDKIIRDEFNKEALKQTKLKTLSLQGDLYTEKSEKLLDETTPLNQPKFSPFMSDDDNYS